MLKYLFMACLVFVLALQANDVVSNEDVIINDEMFMDDECDKIYDQCAIECEEKENGNDKCYSKCEELYEECLLKKEKAE
jgi:hypothetical protein